jgi:hypothetical protein
LTDADKLRAARTEAGGVKFDWENTRENVPPGKTQESRGGKFPLEKRKKLCGRFPSRRGGRRPTSAFGLVCLAWL